MHKIFVDEDEGEKEGQAKKDCFRKVNDPARVRDGCNFQQKDCSKLVPKILIILNDKSDGQSNRVISDSPLLHPQM